MEEIKTNVVVANEELSIKQKAFSNLAQGKRHLYVRDYSEATASLAEACKLFDEIYGPAANECGEAYFNYGKALLELGRSESGVLGDAIDGDESDSSEEADENESDSDKTGDITGDQGEKGEVGKGSEDVPEEAEVKTKEKDEGLPDDAEVKIKEGEHAEENDEDDTLRLAWEILELAKIIFQRQAKDDKQFNLKLADVFLKLGEVSLESENYEQSIEDIKACLNIQQQNLSEDDRCIAETFYQLGIAYSLKGDFDEAIVHFKEAIKVLENRINKLKYNSKNGLDEPKENDPFYSIEGEIKELNELLPEINEKISDMQDFKKETMKSLLAEMVKAKESPKEEPSSSSSAQESSDFDVKPSISNTIVKPTTSDTDVKPATNISHLVRKKRKLDPESESEKSTKLSCVETLKPESKPPE
uniref:Tetratricopeptide SHNi-TPR domain-containing protein n=2 Tax=Timema TaxID=61471 RepID=A0A7R9AP77_TIMSH|nr:unnamed protein product [Timema shepardi]CAD7567524.1 unnamed protein product [Timema californicum]